MTVKQLSDIRGGGVKRTGSGCEEGREKEKVKRRRKRWVIERNRNMNLDRIREEKVTLC